MQPSASRDGNNLAAQLLTPQTRKNPYPLYRKLRQAAPVTSKGPFGAFLVSRYQDSVAVLKDPAHFSSSHMASVDSTLLGADPPSHTRVRKVVSRAFLPERIKTLEKSIRMICEQLVESMMTSGRCDFVQDYAIPLPVTVIGRMLGVEPERYLDMKHWSDAATIAGSSQWAPAKGAAVQASLAEFDAYVRGLIDRRKRQPEDDFVSTLLQGEGTKASLSDDEVASFTKLLLIAGNETTTNFLGNAILILLRHPEVLARLRADRALIPAFIEEALRYDTPVQIAQRRTTEAVVLADVSIPANSLVLILLGSANRDETQFPDPDRFDLDRGADDHLAFGFGAHFCLGAFLARCEAAIALDVLLERATTLSCDLQLDDIPLVESIALRAPARLPLVLSA